MFVPSGSSNEGEDDDGAKSACLSELLLLLLLSSSSSLTMIERTKGLSVCVLCAGSGIVVDCSTNTKSPSSVRCSSHGRPGTHHQSVYGPHSVTVSKAGPALENLCDSLFGDLHTWPGQLPAPIYFGPQPTTSTMDQRYGTWITPHGKLCCCQYER